MLLLLLLLLLPLPLPLLLLVTVPTAAAAAAAAAVVASVVVAVISCGVGLPDAGGGLFERAGEEIRRLHLWLPVRPLSHATKVPFFRTVRKSSAEQKEM